MRAPWLALVLVASCSNNRRPEGAPAPVHSSAIRWASPITVADGDGRRGEWRQNESDYDHVDDGTVAFAGDSLVVAWVDQQAKDVFLRRVTRDGTPGRAVNVSRTPAVFSWLPRLAVRGDDIYVLWQEIVFSGGSHGGDVFFARSRDGGATFEAPRNLSRSRNGDGKGRITDKVWSNGSLDLAVARDGTLYAVWTEFDGALWFARSHEDGDSFTAPKRVNADVRAARAPALATDADNRVYLVWTAGDEQAADLRVTVTLDRGATFAPARVIMQTPGYSDAPKIAVDGAGTLHLVWAESEGGPFTPATIRYARSRDQGATFDDHRELSSAKLAASHAYPMLGIDGSTVLVSWELSAGARQLSRGLGLAYSLDGGRSFTNPSLVPNSADPTGGWNGSHQGQLMEKLAVRDGQLVLANSALAHGRSSRVWLLRGELPVQVTRR